MRNIKILSTYSKQKNQFRCRNTRPKTGRSHYQFKNWIWENEIRKSAVKVRPLKGAYADLINTCYYNPSKGTETLYCLALDLDAHRADKKWKTKSGVLRWPLIKKWLKETHPEIFKYVFAVVRSTSGKGLALYIAVRPLELVFKTKKAQIATSTLQEKLFILFNNHGLGADPSAVGLKRDFCNWQNKKKLAYENILVLRAVHSKRTPVVKNLLAYLKPFNLANYIKKSEREGLLHPDIRAEKKLSKLYLHLYEFWLDGDSSLQISVREMRQLTGLSRPFVEKFLKKPPKWLQTEYLSRSEGWKLSIQVDQTLTCRSSQLRSNQHLFNFSDQLSKPDFVEDGQRNLWITKACLLLKHNGTNEHRALELINDHVSKIPGASDSKNCKNAHRILLSIYGNHQDLFGVNEGCAPAWLLNSFAEDHEFSESFLQSNETINKRTSKRKSHLLKTSNANNFREGGVPPVVFLRKVSRDQCFVFSGNYYSLPKAFVAKKVLIFPWEDKLRIYEDDGITHIHTHSLLSKCKGKYQIEKKHFNIGKLEEQYLDAQIKHFAEDGDAIGAFAKLLVTRYGLFSIRKLWQLRGMIKEYGTYLVNDSVVNSKNLGELRGILKIKKYFEPSQMGLNTC